MKKITFLSIAILSLFSISNCTKTIQDDLCQGIICENGGDCVNGDCVCPEGYEGADCSQETAPSKIKISNIKLKSFPTTDTNGAGWDLFSGADVYVEIAKNDNVLFTTGYVTDLTGSYTYDASFEFSDPKATYSIRVYDYDDSSGDDWMGGISFTPYLNGQDFPSTINVTCGGCVVSFDLTGAVYYY